MGNRQSVEKRENRKRGRDEDEKVEEGERTWWSPFKLSMRRRRIDPPSKRRRIEEKEHDEASAPTYFMCPITREMMVDPVVLMTEAGQSYERIHLERYLENQPNRDPLTNEMHTTALVTAPNRGLKEAISEWRKEHNLPVGIDPPALDPQRVSELERRFPGLGHHVDILLDPNSSDMEVVEAAGSIAEYCANFGDDEEEQRCDAARDAGAIPPLVHLLYSHDIARPENAATAAAFALGCVSQCSIRNRREIRECGGIIPLINLVRISRSVGRVFAAGVLVSLACEAESRKEIVDNGGVIILTQVLKNALDGTDDASAITPACCALFNLTNDNEIEPRNAVLQAGTVTPLVNIVLAGLTPRSQRSRTHTHPNHSAEDSMQTPPILNEEHTADHIFYREDSDIPNGLDLRTSPDVLQALLQADDDARPPPSFLGSENEVRDCAVGILLHLSSIDRDDAGKRAILKANGYEALVRCVQRFSIDQSSVCDRTLAALAKAMESEDTSFRSAIVKAGGIEALSNFVLAQIPHASPCRHAEFHAMLVLYHLACDAENLAKFIEFDNLGVRALVHAAHSSDGARMDGPGAMSALALHAIAMKNGPHRSALIDTNAAEALVKILVNRSRADRVVAMLGLESEPLLERVKQSVCSVLCVLAEIDIDHTMKALQEREISAVRIFLGLIDTGSALGRRAALSLLRRLVPSRLSETTTDHLLSILGFYSLSNALNLGSDQSEPAYEMDRIAALDAAIIVVGLIFDDRVVKNNSKLVRADQIEDALKAIKLLLQPYAPRPFQAYAALTLAEILSRNTFDKELNIQDEELVTLVVDRLRLGQTSVSGLEEQQSARLILPDTCNGSEHIQVQEFSARALHMLVKQQKVHLLDNASRAQSLLLELVRHGTEVRLQHSALATLTCLVLDRRECSSILSEATPLLIKRADQNQVLVEPVAQFFEACAKINLETLSDDIFRHAKCAHGNELFIRLAQSNESHELALRAKRLLRDTRTVPRALLALL